MAVVFIFYIKCFGVQAARQLLELLPCSTTHLRPFWVRALPCVQVAFLPRFPPTDQKHWANGKSEVSQFVLFVSMMPCNGPLTCPECPSPLVQ